MSGSSTSSTRPLLVRLPINVKTYDIDFANIVHNRVYIRWLEDLRQQILEPYLPIGQMFAGRYSPILTHTEVDYRRPIRFGDQIEGVMWVQDLSRTRWTVQAEILKGDVVAATGLQSGYFASLETLRPIRVPALLRLVWEEQRAGSA
ncbi:MAG TPA: thioesterase family protein [Candidatus Binatia bacterium]|nr:thioesterase family protein [Candidatus Binatia bacterium]